jgi:hypothetical protein
MWHGRLCPAHAYNSVAAHTSTNVAEQTKDAGRLCERRTASRSQPLADRAPRRRFLFLKKGLARRRRLMANISLAWRAMFAAPWLLI